MIRRTRYNIGNGSALVVVALAVVVVSATAQDETEAPRPNIIWIMADDLGYGDLSCYGQERFTTPNIDRMAAEGLRFTQHYAGSTVCAPSRSALLTGQHTGHTRVRGNHSSTGERVSLLPEDLTVAELLRDAGYATACFGKWGLGEAGSPGIPTRQGFDTFFGYLNQRNAHFYYPSFLWRDEERVPLEANDPDAQEGAYSHDLITNEALEYVRTERDRPFFLYLAYTIPHAELVAPDDAMAEFMGRFEPETPFEKQHYGAQPAPHAAFAAMVFRLDRDVGRLLNLLRERGLDENTIVFFTSDNGPHAEGGHDPEYFDSNGPFRGIKRDLYEGGIRVPLIAWWPGTVEAGGITDHISAFWDFMATSADLAGAGQEPGRDSLSFVPTLLGRPQDQTQHDYLYWEFYERGGKQAIRQGPWKAVRLDVGGDPDGPVELYDLLDDPGETENLASRHPDRAGHLADLMNRARTPSPHFAFE